MNVELLQTRQRLEAKIDELIDLLDLIDGDENLEPYLADTVGPPHIGGSADDREEENEHGGDIQDVPHDAIDEGNDEPSLGWSNPRCGQMDIPEGWTFSDVPDTALLPGDLGLIFDGDGHHQARKQLREKVRAWRKLAVALDRTRVSAGYGRDCQ